jgi:hypothetical protein
MVNAPPKRPKKSPQTEDPTSPVYRNPGARLKVFERGISAFFALFPVDFPISGFGSPLGAAAGFRPALVKQAGRMVTCAVLSSNRIPNTYEDLRS